MTFPREQLGLSRKPETEGRSKLVKKKAFTARALHGRATKLLQLLRRYDFSREQDPRTEELSKCINLLTREDLVRAFGEAKTGAYVLRDLVHGAPMLSYRGVGEIAFLSLPFARACKELYRKVYWEHPGKSDVQILKVVD